MTREYVTDKAIPGSIPERVKKNAAERKAAERQASDEWVHVDDLCEDCRERYIRSATDHTE